MGQTAGGDGRRPDDGSGSGDPFLNRLIGSANEQEVNINGLTLPALLDTGAMCTSISFSAYNSIPFKEPLQPLDSLGLSLSMADGSSLDYLGYFESTVSVPVLADFRLEVPILVIPDNKFNKTCPVIVGTNVLRRFKTFVSELRFKEERNVTKLPNEWQCAMETLTPKTFCVKACGKRTTTIGPFETVTINGLVRNFKGKEVSIVTETPDNTWEYTVCPRVMNIRHSSTVKIPVRVCNLSAKTLSFKPRSPICTVSETKVVDDLVSNIGHDMKCEDSLEQLGINIESKDLSPEQTSRFHQVVGKWKQVFTTNTKEFSKTDLVKHKIVLEDDTPFKEPYRRIPPAMYEEVRQHVKSMLDAGVIRESDSPYSSNIVLIRKSDGSLRFCVDWRRLNNKTRKDAFMLPRFDDTIDVLHSAKWFSKLDLHSAYWQVEVEEEDSFLRRPIWFL